MKTLHPKVHGGLLLDRNDEAHAAWMNENGVKPIYMVESNLSPFEEAVAGGADLETAAENIDIGGPSMVRSAAKAALLYDSVLIVTEPAQYQEVTKALKENDGDFSTEMRKRFALKAFRRTKEYDSAIVSYLEEN